MKKITIIGFGRFGKVLYRLLKNDFTVTVFTKKVNSKDIPITHNLTKAYASDVIFYAVPIAEFETVISQHKKYFKPHHLLIDVLSVKLHPKNIFEKYLKNTKIQVLLTHPMFGPDSSKEGFVDLPIIIDTFKTKNETYHFWKAYFQKKNLRVIEMTADKHDRLAANSQGLTHFIGRLLDEYNLKPTPIDSLGAKKLLEVKEQTSHDTWELFTGLQHYNPYTKKMRLRLGASYDKLYNKLIPKQRNPNHITIGIQGGRGSFNEEAINYYVKQKNITKYQIVSA